MPPLGGGAGGSFDGTLPPVPLLELLDTVVTAVVGFAPPTPLEVVAVAEVPVAEDDDDEASGPGTYSTLLPQFAAAAPHATAAANPHHARIPRISMR
jgi:hypothetical protein